MCGLMPRTLIEFMLTGFMVSLLMTGQVKAQQTDESQPALDATSESQVISAFRTDGPEVSDIVKIDEQRKHLVMFAMGVPLLILIFTTAGLGVAMGIYGKDVYLAHMIFAGLSLTLALAHAIVGVVWFYPF